MSAYTEWLANKRWHTCSCGHVEWVHWPNGKCAHCDCKHYDGKPPPPPEDTIEVRDDG